MASPYIGEIRMFGGSFAPAGWAMCNGQTIPISQNDTLFTLIGTTYGGDGQETFQLPNLQSRIPIHAGTGKFGTTYQLGETAGTESVTLSTNQMPNHNHALIASTGAATAPSPNNNILAASATISPYVKDVAGPQLVASAVQPQGGSQPHENMMPFLVITFIISLFGIFPTQN
jgi:microcystin-dependent protein